MQIGRNDTFSNQEAQERSHREHGLTTTTSLQPGSFTANEIADVACIQRAPVRLTLRKRFDQPTRISDIIVAGVARYSMNPQNEIATRQPPKGAPIRLV
jgi:hypothetical protein